MIDTKFLEELASSAPTPGGGGASAYVGALATSLSSMVGNLTVGKKKFADIEAQVNLSLEKLSDLRVRLVELVEEDAAAFEPLAAAYKMPHDTKEQEQCKNEAMQTALRAACEVPLDIMENCSQVILESDFLARKGSRMVVSDAGCGVMLACAAMEAASLNVYINIKSLNDKDLAGRYEKQADDLLCTYRKIATSTFQYVLREIRG